MAEASLSSIAYGDGMFVAVGSHSTILTSPDGITWTKRSANVPGIINFYGISYGKGCFVAVGSLSDLVGFPSGFLILTSPDGVNWTAQTSNVPFLLSISYGNGLFIAVGYSKIAISFDGISWSYLSRPGYREAITYANGFFLAIDSRTRIYASVDGDTWINRGAVYGIADLDGISDNNNHLSSLSYGNGIYVAVGGWCDMAVIPMPCRLSASSSDLTKWIDSSRVFYLGNSLRSVTYGLSNFVAVGQGTIESSSDGVTWVTRLSVRDYALNAVAYNNNTFVAVGDGGLILQSDPVIEPVEVPTLSEWGIMLFAAMAGLAAGLVLNRQTIN